MNVKEVINFLYEGIYDIPTDKDSITITRAAYNNFIGLQLIIDMLINELETCANYTIDDVLHKYGIDTRDWKEKHSESEDK